MEGRKEGGRKGERERGKEGGREKGRDVGVTMTDHSASSLSDFLRQEKTNIIQAELA